VGTRPRRLIEVEVVRTAELDERARAEVIRVCLAAHEEPDFENLFSYVPADGLHICGRLDGRLVSHAGVSTRWLRHDNGPRLRTAYVDAVATDPAEQGRGHGSAVMRALASEVSDYDIACLETSDAQEFYERLGWERWRGPLAGRSGDELIPTPGEGVMILRLPRTPALDLDGLLTVEVQGRIW
jgi:aminoglycoside 2'-N-acetyltransferase I